MASTDRVGLRSAWNASLEEKVASNTAEPRTKVAPGAALPQPFVAAAAVVALVFLVALGSSRSLDRVGGPGHVLSGRSIAGDIGVMMGVVSLLVLAAIAWAVLGGGRGRRKRDDEPEWVYEQPEAPWWEKPLLLAMALLPAAGLVAAIVFLVRRWGHAVPPAQTGVPPTATAPAPADGHPGAGSPAQPSGLEVHWWLWAAFALVLIAAALVALLWRRLHPFEQSVRETVEARQLQALIEESLEDLERDPDPRRAVIRAYTAMERALARRGLGRRPFEAPLEYLTRALVALRVSRPAGERLTGLFQRARFSEHTIEPQMKQEAITALARVRDELAEQQQ
jgi:hypothetical protein